MDGSPEFATSEAGGVQLQVLTTLANLGWTYLTVEEVHAQRRGRQGAVILEDVALESLARINGFEQDGVRYAFTASAVHEGLSKLRELRFDGLLKTNENATDLALLGTAIRQEVDGLIRERPFRFVAWSPEERHLNSFHMTAEMSVDGRDETIRVDVVLFVNGIPLGSIELKRSSDKLSQGISQTLRNQNPATGAPQLFSTMQVLIAGAAHGPRYATVGTPEKYWSVWREPAHGAISDAEIEAAVNTRPPPDVMDRIYEDFRAHAARHAGLQEAGSRWVTELDRTVVGLCRPDRLLDLTRRFTLFDKGVKKIARYQQVSAVLRILERIEQRDDKARRLGGVIWHTQGSGKSLTMMMLARALVWALSNARVILVTDRRDLDRQIKKTFLATGLSPIQARTGEHLMQLVRDREPLITTLINKFRSGVRKREVVDNDEDVFILVDESHRSQYGNDESMHEDMRRVFPRACYLGFTGTPLTKRDRNTFQKFGELIDRYTIEQAVEDGAVVPLLYEGRAVAEEFNDAALDAWFDRASEGLSEDQKYELKRRMSAPGVLQAVPGRLKAIAWDIRQHFLAGFADTGLKGQVVAPSKAAAVRLKRIFDELNDADDERTVTAEVVISAPDKREGHEDIEQGPKEEVAKFWAEAMKRYGDEDAYNAAIIDAFDSGDAPDLIIVVSKLLTGFDVQRNAVLYIAQPLKEHNLLQAIARVNRVFDADDAPPKPFGYIVDYCGVLENLSQALTSYAALEGFDEADLRSALISIRGEAERLPELHAELLDVFVGISNRYDQEAYAQALADEALRDRFSRALSAFAGALNVALGSREFLEETPPDRLRRWKDDLKRFELLRQEVRQRYAETIDWKRYEARVQRLLDEHITAHEVTTVVEPLNVFDDGAIEAELEREGGRTTASLADEIASRLTRTITERMDEDPGFYGPFSRMVRNTIDAFRQRRIDEQEYLRRIRELRDQGTARSRGEGDDVPETVKGNPHAVALWSVVREELAAGEATAATSARIAVDLLAIVEGLRRVGWQDSPDALNEVRAHFDDYFFDVVGPQFRLSLTADQIDAVSDRVLSVARERLPK